MTRGAPPTPPSGLALEILASPRVGAALSAAAIGTAVLSQPIRNLIGWSGLGGMLGALVFLAAGSLFARRYELDWRGILPVTLLAFLGWCALTMLWSQYNWSTLSGLLYQLTIAFLGVYIALTRDLIQIVRSTGDVLRLTLTLSLALEVFAGALIDQPIGVLGIAGGLGVGDPLQGLFGSRNQFGFVALLAGVTFAVEYLTRSVSQRQSIFSGSLVVITLLLTRSPGTAVILLALAFFAFVLRALRRTAPERRGSGQIAVLAVVAGVFFIGLAARSRILELLNAGSEFEARYSLWQAVLMLVRQHNLEGWGWAGYWRRGIEPFAAAELLDGRAHSSALNAFLDMWLQAGLIGALALALLLGLALLRSWLLASNQRSVVFVWPTFILIAFAINSLAESYVLVDYGFLFLVICTVVSAHHLSWRRRLGTIAV